MGRLRYAQKFLLIGVVLIAPLGFVVKSYLDVQSRDRAFAAKERVGVVYLRPLEAASLKPGIFTWHAGASLELGNVFAELNDITLSSLHPAGSVFLGVDTIIGPAYAGFGLVEGGQTSVFLVFGRVF